MIQRCYNSNLDDFKLYGGRGITVCARWRYGEDGLSGYECFVADMGPKPSPQYSLDRTDNDLGYFLSNCRWATWSEQRRNQRPRKRVRAV
jgi:hypothetical protein